MPLDRVFQSLAELTERMQGALGLDDASAQIVDYALAHLGSDLAGLTTREPNGPPLRLAASSPVLSELDAAGTRLGHGPGSESLDDEAVITIPDTREDPLWPGWSAVAAQHEVMSVRVVGMPPLRGRPVSLELYSHRPHAFTADGLTGARTAAKHAGLALRYVDRIVNLEEAMQTRALIGQAQGILMERYSLTSDQAMSFLRRNSQETNVKVRDLADALVTGEERLLDSIVPLTERPPDNPSTRGN